MLKTMTQVRPPVILVVDDQERNRTILNEEEWKIMKAHPVIGERICAPLKSFGLVLPIILTTENQNSFACCGKEAYT